MRELGRGFGYLVKGQRWVAQHGKRFGWGLLPGLVTLVLYAGALVALVLWGTDLVSWATPFADDWSGPWTGLFRGFLTALLFALALLLSVVTFTAVTLVIGEPFYESLSEQVDISVAGFAPESGLPLWREILISVRDSLRIVVRAVLWGVLLFGLGFLPVVGQTVIPVIGFLVTGFFLVEELTAVALARRGVRLRDRLALLRARKTLAWGFGAPLAVFFLVPFVAVFLMPGAVAGATLMARDLMGESTDDPDDPDDPDNSADPADPEGTAGDGAGVTGAAGGAPHPAGGGAPTGR
ncbi:EI24 domain-containing protein [Streptomyces aureocirculatus]|uniref:EI24 domain-containing protein n=1 Tax=Streptomyces aureocirculatus TaxID=67275 RepID=UPI00099B7D3A|nr:EI24 domain-containing protein [Streptomyces aureocirculatus]